MERVIDYSFLSDTTQFLFRGGRGVGIAAVALVIGDQPHVVSTAGIVHRSVEIPYR
jgi:hypothetical protein